MGVCDASKRETEMMRRDNDSIALTLKLLLGLFFPALIALTLSELPLLWNDGGGYPFGWEGGGWVYSSRETYAAVLVVEGVVALIGFALAVRRCSVTAIGMGIIFVSGHLMLFP